MAAVFKGAINFGLINIPISLNVAVSNEDVKFRMLHKECNTPIQYRKFCPHCNKQVETKDLVKGFEYEKDKYVVMSDEELKKLEDKSSKYIQILDFINLAEIDPIYFEKTYFVKPEKNAIKAYDILFAAMQKTKRVAIAKITLRTKEHLCVIRCFESTLSLSIMHYPSEIRAAGEKKKSVITSEELDMAKKLIENLTAPFDVKKYTSKYRQELLKIIDKKIKNKKVAIKPKIQIENANTISLFEKLKASIEASKTKSA